MRKLRNRDNGDELAVRDRIGRGWRDWEVLRLRAKSKVQSAKRGEDNRNGTSTRAGERGERLN